MYSNYSDMKKISVTLALMIITILSSAQNHNTWIHQGNYPESQCYDIIEMSDGNLMVREAVFDENREDIAYILYKITPQGVLLDSLFIEDHNIYALNPMLRDPSDAGSTIMTSFYNLDDANYYKATYINDNLEITDEVVTILSESCLIPRKFFVDSNHDMICRAKIDDNNFCLMRIGLDGTLKYQSEAISTSGSESGIVLEHPVFQISSEPLEYGYILFRNNDITIDIYDEWFNKLERKTIKSFDGWNLGTSIYTNACATGDGGYIITTEARRLQGSQIVIALLVLKINFDFEIEKAYSIGEYTYDSYPQYDYQNRNLCVTDNNIYLVWDQKKDRQEKLSIQTLFVSCLDMNLNPVWSEPTISLLDAGMFGNYGMTTLSNGGVAIAGWLADELTYYDSKNIYAVIFDNYLSTDEISFAEKPFVCYPNPAKDIININFAENSTCNAIEIYALDGLLVKTYHGASLQTAIDISSLTPGVYVMKLKMDDGKEFSERIVKQ